MDKLSAMQAFVRVVESGTFTKAADSLGLPKTTVTRLVQALEGQLQTQLLNRTTRRVTITAEGAAYFDRALRLLGDLAEIESSMTRAKSNPRGRLRIGAPSSVGQLLLIPHLPEFQARYPDVQIELATSDRPIDLVDEHIDCAFIAGEISDLSLVARSIGEFQTMLCAAPAYLQRHGVPAQPRDIESGHRMVNYLSPRTAQPSPWTLKRGAESVEVHVVHAIAVNDSAAGLAACLAGLGIVATAPFKARPHLAEGTLVPVLPAWNVGTIPLHLAYPPNRHLSAKVRVFIDWAVALFARADLLSSRYHLPAVTKTHERLAAEAIAEARGSSLAVRA